MNKIQFKEIKPEKIEKILDYDERQPSNLNYLRMRNNIKNYKCEIPKLKKFSEEI